MNCFYHENVGAVATCVDCGVGLCKDCVQGVLYTRDNKPICLNCSKKEASAQANMAYAEFASLRMRLIVCIVIFFAGIIVFNMYPAHGFFAMIGVWCLANIGLVLITIFRPVDNVSEALEKHKDFSEWFLGRLVGGLIVAVFGGIFLPVQILWVAFKLIKAKKQTSALKESESRINSIKM